MGMILTCQKGYDDSTRELESDDVIDNLSILSDISDLTEVSDIYGSFDERIEESMDINGIIKTKKYYNALHNLTVVDVAY